MATNHKAVAMVPVETKAAIDEKNMIRFRKYFPDSNRKALTAAFGDLVRIAHVDAGNGRKPLNLAQFKYSVTKLFPEIAIHFSEFELHSIFDFLDIDGTGTITLFEFTKGVRGRLQPYRQLLVNFVFQKLDAKNDQKLDETELLDYFASSADPTILSGLVQPRFKVQAVFKEFDAVKSIISKGQFEDFYISRSLRTPADAVFKKDILSQWLMADSEADKFLSQALTGNVTVTSSRMTSRRSSRFEGNEDGKPNDVHAEALMRKFRKFFPDLSRHALTAEFKMLSAAVFDDKKNAPGLAPYGTKKQSISTRPVGLAEFKFGITVVKPAITTGLTDKELTAVFNYMDPNDTSRVTLFEFVTAVRGSLSPFRHAIVEYAFDCMDKEALGVVDEYHLLKFFEEAHFPEVADGNTTAAAKTAHFIKSLGLGGSASGTKKSKKNDVEVRFEQLVEYYISKSLETEEDSQFRDDVVKHFNLKVTDLDRYIARNYPKLAIKLTLVNRSSHKSSVKGDKSTSEGEGGAVEPFDALLNRFRRYFASPERYALTLDFKKLMKAIEAKGVKHMGLKEFRYALDHVRPDISSQFNDRDLSRLFQYFDLSSAHRITLFEFVKQMRGPMSPYRAAIIEYIFLYVDTKNDGYLDQQEVLYFYQNSELQDIVDGSTTPAVRTFIFFKALGQTDRRVVKLDMLVDFYLTKSLQVDTDEKFKKDVLAEWNLTDAEVDAYIAQKYPKLLLPATPVPPTPVPPSTHTVAPGTPTKPSTAASNSDNNNNNPPIHATATPSSQLLVVHQISDGESSGSSATRKKSKGKKSIDAAVDKTAVDKAVAGAIEGLGQLPHQPTTEKYTITRRHSAGEPSDEVGSPDQETSSAVKTDDKISDSQQQQPTKPSPSKPTGSKSSFSSPPHRVSQLKDNKDETTTMPGKIPLSPSGMALSELLSGTSDDHDDIDRIQNEVNHSTPDQLRSLLTSALIALHEQRRDISKLNIKMDALVKLLIEKKTFSSSHTPK